VKEYLSRQNVPFEDTDVSRYPAAASEMLSLSGQRGVTVTVINGGVVVGYDPLRLQQLLAQAHPMRLGAAVADARRMAAKGRCAMTSGAYVGRVDPEGPAARSGLQPGDVIISFADLQVDTALALTQLISRVRPGQSLGLTYVREGREHNTLLRF